MEVTMALRFFKKSITADLVLKNGTVLTQNADMPYAEAVACKDDEIIAVGDYESIKPFIDANTEVIDMGGGFALPGIISLFGNPVMKAFDGKYLNLLSCKTIEELLSSIASWAEIHIDDEIIFGFGYNEGLFDKELLDDQEAITKLIDSGFHHKPVLLLGQNNVSCIFNSAAYDIIKQTAEEEMVTYITTPYILNLFVPFDFEKLEEDVARLLLQNAQMGITSALSLGAPDYFQSLYQDVLISLYNEDSLTQRFFSSYTMNRPLLPKGLIHRLMQMKTTCNELGNLINAKMLLVDLNSDECPMEFSEQALDTISEEVSDKNFDIYFLCHSQADTEKAYLASEYVRSKGYKNIICIESDYPISEEIKQDLIWYDSIHSVSKDNKEEFLQNAPIIVGLADKIGAIKPGMLADIAVFKSDPTNKAIDSQQQKSIITVFNGKVVYK